MLLSDMAAALSGQEPTESRAPGLPEFRRCCYGPFMEPDPKPPTVPEKPLAERLIKYLPIFVVSHALVTIPTYIMSIALAYATFVQADATKKIQMSETWPNVSYGTSN